MAYNADADKLIAEKLTKDGVYRVAIFSYNGGEQKIAVQMKDMITPKNTTTSKEVWKNVSGRLKISTYVEIAKLILEIIQ